MQHSASCRPFWATTQAAATPNGASTTAKRSLHNLTPSKAARRAEAQTLIAAAKTRLVAVQQRLQEQERAAVVAGNTLVSEQRVLAPAEALMQAAADNQQLQPHSTAAAAAAALASKVASGAARADRAAAKAAAAALGEAESQRKLLARLAFQLEAVQLERAPRKVPAAQHNRNPAQAQPAPAPRRQGWDPLRRLLAPVGPLMAALAGTERQRPA